MNQTYYFVFRDSSNKIVAVRPYMDRCEYAARKQAERDIRSLNAARVCRAKNYQRNMVIAS